MSTEFYWEDGELACPAPCAHCAHSTRFHVGHQAGGWSFIFRAWPQGQSPFGFEVSSRADWRNVFARRGRLADEYGKEYLDPIGWLNDLKAPNAEQIHKETLWLGGWAAEDTPRDPEGFRIKAYEFS